jgi:hypothetical protein
LEPIVDFVKVANLVREFLKDAQVNFATYQQRVRKAQALSGTAPRQEFMRAVSHGIQQIKPIEAPKSPGLDDLIRRATQQSDANVRRSFGLNLRQQGIHNTVRGNNPNASFGESARFGLS